MNGVEGWHHLAIATADMKAQVSFFTDKLGMELVPMGSVVGSEPSARVKRLRHTKHID